MEDGESTYSSEIVKAREHFKMLIMEDPLQKGLILSSQSFMKYGVTRYMRSDPKAPGKQELQAERNLIKYVSRIYAKTSPYSTFTSLSIKDVGSASRVATVGNQEGQDISSDVISYIRLNNDLCKYFLEVLTKIPAIYQNFLMRLNPTIRIESDQFVCLTTMKNIESFQLVPVTPFL